MALHAAPPTSIDATREHIVELVGRGQSARRSTARLDETPIVRLVNGRPTMVGRRRRGFLPGLVQAGSV